MKKFLLTLVVIACAALGVYIFFFEKQHGSGAPGAPELSGWIAWWEEDKGYALLQKHGTDFHTVSPFWYFIGSDLTLKETTASDKPAALKKLRANGVAEILP